MKTTTTLTALAVTLLLSAAAAGQQAAATETTTRQHGADGHSADKDSVSALLHAAEQGHCEVVSRLLDRGANINAVDKDGHTALSLARLNGHDELAALLTSRGAAPNPGTTYIDIPDRHVMCPTCKGGLPFRPNPFSSNPDGIVGIPLCQDCGHAGGKVSITSLCFKESQFIPLWHHLGHVGDFYFIGNATIEEAGRTLTIRDQKIISCSSGSIRMQNLKYSQVSYGAESCKAKTAGIIGMLDYENTFALTFDNGMLKNIRTACYRDPGTQVFMRGYATPHSGDAYGVWHSTGNIFLADCWYSIAPDRIACGDTEYFFRNGILIKESSHGQTTTYRYIKFDRNHNWLERDVFRGTSQTPCRQKRTIRYDSPQKAAAAATGQ